MMVMIMIMVTGTIRSMYDMLMVFQHTLSLILDWFLLHIGTLDVTVI